MCQWAPSRNKRVTRSGHKPICINLKGGGGRQRWLASVPLLCVRPSSACCHARGSACRLVLWTWWPSAVARGKLPPPPRFQKRKEPEGPPPPREAGGYPRMQEKESRLKRVSPQKSLASKESRLKRVSPPQSRLKRVSPQKSLANAKRSEGGRKKKNSWLGFVFGSAYRVSSSAPPTE
jgi:hypothetical protein